MNTQKGFTLVEGLLIVLVLAIAGFGGWYVWNQQQDDETEQFETTQELQNNNETSEEQVVIQEERVEQQLTSSEKEDCTVTYPVNTNTPFNDNGLFINPVTYNTAFLVCVYEPDERHYVIVEDNLRFYLKYTDKDFFEFDSGAPGDEAWFTSLNQIENGYKVTIDRKNSENLENCKEVPEAQNCGGDFEANVIIEHPNIQTIRATIIDNEAQDSPNYSVYEELIKSIILPEQF
jgi:type II secretory pathway pseudopilin PulG